MKKFLSEYVYKPLQLLCVTFLVANTLRELIFAGTNFRENIFIFFLIFARTNFRENTTF